MAYRRIDDLLARYPLRGIKGPVGHRRRTCSTCSASAEAVAALEAAVGQTRSPGPDRVLTSVGQVYPRSLDYEVVSALVQLAAGPASLATTIRLMAGAELATEGFKPGQVGSSAMPHKMNTRSCERVCGLAVVLRGYASMTAELAGAQWNEGDVFCSVVRRVALPDAFYALDGLYRDVPDRARRLRRLPGGDRARSCSGTCRSWPPPGADGSDAGRRRPRGRARGDQGDTPSRWRWPCASPGSRTTTCSTGWPPTPAPAGPRSTRRAAGRAVSFTGLAVEQVAAVATEIGKVTAAHPAAARYRPGAIL